MDLLLPNKINSAKGEILRDARQVTIIGANGAGKTRFVNKLVEQCGDQAFRISALRAIYPVEHEEQNYKGSISERFNKLNQNMQQVVNTAKSEVRQTISALKKHLVSKGAPVIFGEWGTSTDAAYDNYRDNMLAFARYFVQQAKASNIATFYWMGLSDGAHRSVPEFNQTDLKDAIIKGYYGDEGYTHITTQSTSNAPEISSCYNLQGGRISFPQQGINIIRMTDGTSRKISRHQ